MSSQVRQIGMAPPGYGRGHRRGYRDGVPLDAALGAGA